MLAAAGCGKTEETQTTGVTQPAAEAAKPAETAKPVASASANVQPEKGEKVFKTTCSMCHQSGAAGAPIVGKKDEWKARIAQGMPTLYNHAIKGFKGNKGMMPAKGGNPSLSDDDVKAGVDYMVSKAR